MWIALYEECQSSLSHLNISSQPRARRRRPASHAARLHFHPSYSTEMRVASKNVLAESQRREKNSAMLAAPSAASFRSHRLLPRRVLQRPPCLRVTPEPPRRASHQHRGAFAARRPPECYLHVAAHGGVRKCESAWHAEEIKRIRLPGRLCSSAAPFSGAAQKGRQRRTR